MLLANHEKKQKSHSPDLFLLLIISVLLVFGIVSLSTASSVVAFDKFGDAYFFVRHQLYGLGFGLIAFVFFSRMNYRTWRRFALGFLFFSIFLLLLVFIPGLSAHYGKARSWINVFGFSLQPSEFVKLSFLLYLAAWLEARKKDLHDISQGIGPFVGLLGFIAFLMLLQPDLGTLLIISGTSLIVYFVGGGSVKHISLIIMCGLIGLAAMVYVKPYQMNRFKCMIDPSFSAADICYQTNQSLIAVGSGGIFGRGLGGSRQKFMYLPEVSGDSIFAIIAEEFGLLICILLVTCYLFLFYRGYLVSQNINDDFGRILSIGIVTWIMLQAVINIGGIISLMPMTGVPLPLISYGGSSILATMSALGVLTNISKHTK